MIGRRRGCFSRLSPVARLRSAPVRRDGRRVHRARARCWTQLGREPQYSRERSADPGGAAELRDRHQHCRPAPELARRSSGHLARAGRGAYCDFAPRRPSGPRVPLGGLSGPLCARARCPRHRSRECAHGDRGREGRGGACREILLLSWCGLRAVLLGASLHDVERARPEVVRSRGLGGAERRTGGSGS